MQILRVEIKVYIWFMNNNRLITGVTVTMQMSKAQEILKTQVIPREQLFQKRKKLGQLSKKLSLALKANA